MAGTNFPAHDLNISTSTPEEREKDMGKGSRMEGGKDERRGQRDRTRERAGEEEAEGEGQAGFDYHLSPKGS